MSDCVDLLQPQQLRVVTRAVRDCRATAVSRYLKSYMVVLRRQANVA